MSCLRFIYSLYLIDLQASVRLCIQPDSIDSVIPPIVLFNWFAKIYNIGGIAISSLTAITVFFQSMMQPTWCLVSLPTSQPHAFFEPKSFRKLGVRQQYI
jgi:hypothetical protein